MEKRYVVDDESLREKGGVVREVDDLMYVAEAYPKDLGYIVSQLVEAVNELMEQVDELKRRNQSTDNTI